MSVSAGPPHSPLHSATSMMSILDLPIPPPRNRRLTPPLPQLTGEGYGPSPIPGPWQPFAIGKGGRLSPGGVPPWSLPLGQREPVTSSVATGVAALQKDRRHTSGRD